MALDEPKDNDSAFEDNGIHVLVETRLLHICGAIKIDFIDTGHHSGFSVTSAKPLGGAGCAVPS
ncbi:hypothetical protein VU06_03710 [Desulfobulbus sp. F3]|nr:hypothetical protein [Desulfobulbus sp. F3]